VVEVIGDLDLATAPGLRQDVVGVLSAGARRLVIDLSPTDFVDSVGLGILVAVHKRVRVHDGELAIVCPDPRLRRLFVITDLDRVFRLVDTVDQAMGTAT
jgi:anti-sigma B factor antagonist